jgi:hypothetical protein
MLRVCLFTVVFVNSLHSVQAFALLRTRLVWWHFRTLLLPAAINWRQEMLETEVFAVIR